MSDRDLERFERVACRESLARDFSEIVRFLAGTIGPELTAYIAGQRHTDRVQAWIDGEESHGDIEVRLRLAFRVVMLLRHRDYAPVVAAWLQGINPDLDDRMPIVMLREGAPEREGDEVLAAARASVAGPRNSL